ncbi:hybrid sensor histidine kinase/response regulator [Chengkuizengella axinellae]|uniref:histidine kinase n=1 Tax=Chengkuizengella axinellae TaxID=3064388 RepID=A0ABT9J2R7_9BACL|nr:ATP-binding protein [Chengkuizengella sp. 2205SS18-9]MDP5275294.1 ATP-binding protein [Chengkuizengella sp. 2205SS18-9]
MKVKVGAVMLLILIALTIFGVMTLFESPTNQSTPMAENGVLNLSEWDFEEGGNIPLDGEWEFYPYQAFEPIDFEESKQGELKPYIVPVPVQYWTSYDLDGETMDAIGVATYRLKINMEGKNQTFGFKTDILHGTKLFVNGELIGDNPISSPRIPYVRYATMHSGINEIILQVENKAFALGGGIYISLNFGTQEEISSLRDSLVMNNWITISIFLIMGLYFIGLYGQWNKDSFLLFFSIYCLAMAVYYAVNGEGVWFMVFPDTPIWLMPRLRYVSFMAAHLSLILYIYTYFKHVSSKRLVWVVVSLGLGIIIYEILFPRNIPSWMLITTYVYMFFSMAYGTYVMCVAFLKKMEGAVYLIVGSLTMSIPMLKQYFSVTAGVKKFVLSFPLEPFILLLMFALLMSLRYSNAFKRNKQLSEELLKVDEVKDEFLAKTSHELRTPLHGIINISSFLLEEERGSKSKKYSENLSLIHDTSLKLSNLVNDLIDVTRLRNGEFRLQSTTVDLKVSAQIVLDVLAFEVKGKPIQLISKIEDSVFVVADENRLRQILYNLIHNAIKHTEHGEIIISSKQVNDIVYLYVKDTGIGIPEDKKDEIFGYFEQLDKLSPQNGYQSMGLGLYISRQLIHKMSGEIWVDWSEVGQGTRVAFTLPKTEYSEQKASQGEDTHTFIQPDMPSTSNLSSGEDFDSIHTYDKTILVVDDESTNIHVLLNLLSKQGYNVITAFSAKEALRKMDKYQDIDLAILDVMMPVMSGIELCQAIREKHNLLELPILFATAKDRPEDIELGFKAGANDYITKPFDGNTILARIQTLLSMKSSMEDAFHNEMAFLQAQIKPHFLYNAMTNIISFCYTDGEKAAYLLDMLSQYLQIIFNIDHKITSAPIERELNLIEAYVEIEKARFDRFEFQYFIDEGLEDERIPSFCIQPFVENSIRHGIFQKDGMGEVSLTIQNLQESIRVVIEDDGVGISPEILNQFENEKLKSSGIGMTNIKKRLDSIKGANIDIQSKLNQGTKVTLNIPKQIKKITQLA